MEIINEFCPRFTPEAVPIYVGDTDEKWAHFDKERFDALDVTLDPHSKMPDVVVHLEAKDWLVLIEAVTTHGSVDPKCHIEFNAIFAGARPSLVFVSACLTRKDLMRFLDQIAWGPGSASDQPPSPEDSGLDFLIPLA